jgi:hypothetical protein
VRGTRNEAPRCHLRAGVPPESSSQHQTPTARRARPSGGPGDRPRQSDRLGGGRDAGENPTTIQSRLRASNLFLPLLICWGRKGRSVSFACTAPRPQFGSVLLCVLIMDERICDCGCGGGNFFSFVGDETEKGKKR